MNEDRNAEFEDVVFIDDAEPGAGSEDGSGREGDELERLQAEVQQFREQYLRKLADFENYRRRQERDMADFRRLSHADLVKECLPVLDNLERALEVSDEGGSGFKDGVELILRQLKDVLARFGLEEIDPRAQQFDPTYHEAVQRQEVEGLDGPTVVQVLLKGYQLHERLLRPAMVVVGVPAAGGRPDANSEESHG